MQSKMQVFGAAALLVSTLSLGGGCTDGEGLDLGVRGRLTLHIERESTSAEADVFGSVNDIKSLFFPVIVLEKDQVLSVNSVKIPHLFGLHDGEIGSVNAPDTYTVTFDNKGSVKSVVVTPPADFAAFSPDNGVDVSRTGFEITWAPSGDAEVLVDVKIRGLKKVATEDDDDDEDDPTKTWKYISNLPDSGSVTIGEADLAKFLNGEIDLSVSRVRKFSGDVGLADTAIRVSCTMKRSLTLTD